MSEIKNLNLKQAEEKMASKQEELGTIFEEAGNESGGYDHSQVKSFGLSFKNGTEFRDEVKARNAELDELGQHIEGLREIDTIADAHSKREKGRRGFPLPGAGGQGGAAPANQNQFKSIGELIAQSAQYKAWTGKGAPQGIDFSFDNMLASDFLASKGAVMTLQQKALFQTTAGYAPESIRLPGFVEMATRPLQLIDILPMSQTGQAAIPYMEETTRDHLAAEIAEGGAYPEDAYAFTEKTSPVRKIGTTVPVTDEQLEDAPFMESYLNGRLTFGVRQRLDSQCMAGDGVGANLRGILNVAGIQTQALGADVSLDAMFKAMTKIRTIGRAIPTHNVMLPTTWEGIRLTKTADGVYIFGPPTEAGPERLWGLPVIQNESLTAGTALIGSFDPSWITLSERRGIDIQVGYVDAQFKEGKRTVRADMRGALTVFRPPVFCTVTGL